MRFLQYVISGLASGSIYALVALGLALIYRSNRILNFAHGDMATAGTFFAFIMLGLQIPYGPSFGLGLLFGFVIAVLFYYCVLIPAQRREATQLGQIILTLGFGLILQGAISYFGGTEPQMFPFPLSEAETYQLGTLIFDQLSLGTLAVGIVASLLFYLLIQKTRIGLAMRATSENLPAAQTMGIPTRKILALSWGLAAFLGVLAGLFLAPALLLDPFFMLEPFLKGFAAAILGGLNSLPGAIVGGLILGVSESLAGAYISVAFKNTFAFLIIIVVLLVRPEGLLGEEFKERV
ncbi:MAG: branched-chain amino acid ABC transporter permease [Deltaproteobacteria bacterium]|nr:branched-chain amino acid ABC transporter permease [Deltaproteobacteria bacterium]MBW1929358.1 branched-chain amino acid ABC transporter permease [Deltaproteobacteria bacterium]MBW2026053.1 branched-chain amino acid ABC transporter permease [Deltaproteobacteria bacterium]MBW2126773.1 branched-chain amino acid ABC transporter permease [Deltaproteobacteria bacterium]RLB21715.1 MAG: branched-chain amino acid ABC transporter permease [Deltaproteobacteria bacterium]